MNILQSPVHADVLDEITAGGAVIRKALFKADRVAPRGSALIGQDEPNSRIVGLRTGWAARARNMATGRRGLLAIYLPGDLIGIDCLSHAVRHDDVVAISDTTYGTIGRDELHRLLLHDRSVWMTVLHEMVIEQRRADEWGFGMARESALERVAAFILGIHDRLEERVNCGNSFQFPMTQQDIGDHLGLTVVHVNRMLRLLRESGIAVIRRGLVAITDLPHLRRLACSAPSRELGLCRASMPSGPPLH